MLKKSLLCNFTCINLCHFLSTWSNKYSRNKQCMHFQTNEILYVFCKRNNFYWFTFTITFRIETREQVYCYYYTFVVSFKIQTISSNISKCFNQNKTRPFPNLFHIKCMQADKQTFTWLAYVNKYNSCSCWISKWQFKS